MKTIGIEIKSLEAILVVMEEDASGNIVQSDDSIKFSIQDSKSNDQVRQFWAQLNASFDSINPDRIGILARIASAQSKFSSSGYSFKLEGLFQLYEKMEVEIISPQTISAFLKRNPCPTAPNNKYQANALNLAYYLLKEGRR